MNFQLQLHAFILIRPVNGASPCRAGPSRCGAQCKT